MRKQYLKPPLIEAFFEVKFKSEDWDITYSADFYNKVKDLFPIKQTTQQKSLGVKFDASGVNIGSLNEGIPILQCLDETKNIIVQFAQNILTISINSSYLGWDHFKTLIFKVFKSYLEVVNTKELGLITLRFRNKVETGERHSYNNLKTYFQLLPNIPENIFNVNAKSLKSAQMLLEIPSEDGKNILAIHQATLVKEDNKAPILLDLKYLCIDSGDLVNEDNLSDWLDLAHESIENAFEEALTNLAIDSFN